MNPLARLAYLWRTPSAFLDDWRAYARNVILHAVLVGLVSAACDVFVPGYGFIAGGLLYAVWEATQWRLQNAAPDDCLEDWGFVQSGALAYLTADWRIAAIAASFLLSGILRRRN